MNAIQTAMETGMRNALADVLGAIGIVSAGLGIALTIGLWAWYLWDTHRTSQVPARHKKRT